VSSKLYNCKLNPFEEDYLEDNKLGFSDFVHKAFYINMRKDYQYRLERIGIRILYILVGMVVLSFITLTSDIISYLIVFFTGFFCIVFGFISLGLEVRNGRKQ